MAKEMICETVGGDGCGLKRVLDLIGGKWKILILCATNTMLAQSLKEMEADGLVLRRQFDEIPVRVEYSLTSSADSLIPILLELKDWGEAHLEG